MGLKIRFPTVTDMEEINSHRKEIIEIIHKIYDGKYNSLGKILCHLNYGQLPFSQAKKENSIVLLHRIIRCTDYSKTKDKISKIKFENLLAQFKVRFTDYDRIEKAEITFEDLPSVEIINSSSQKMISKDSDEQTPPLLQTEVIEFGKILRSHYNNDNITQGIKLVNEQYPKYKSIICNYPDILRDVIRFNMRKSERSEVRSIINELNLVGHSDKIYTFLYLSLVECDLREAYEVYQNNMTEYCKNILIIKEVLNRVPKSEHSSFEYCYWHGKLNLNLWYASGGTNLLCLRQSLEQFENALIIKPENWWCYCYKCIALKLFLGDKNEKFTNEADKYKKIINKIESKRSSIRSYKITSFLLTDDEKGLKDFLYQNNTVKPTSDMHSTIFFHNSLIFFRTKEKKKKYKYNLILEDWIKSSY